MRVCLTRTCAQPSSSAHVSERTWQCPATASRTADDLARALLGGTLAGRTLSHRQSDSDRPEADRNVAGSFLPRTWVDRDLLRAFLNLASPFAEDRNLSRLLLSHGGTGAASRPPSRHERAPRGSNASSSGTCVREEKITLRVPCVCDRARYKGWLRALPARRPKSEYRAERGVTVWAPHRILTAQDIQ